MKKVPVDDKLEQILVSAERYALGRMTYMVPVTVDYILQLVTELSDKTLYTMLTDIQKAPRLGMECDARDWRRLEQAILQERERRMGK